MPRYVAIADTNYYRGKSEADIAATRELERQAGIDSWASFTSLLELLAHAADPGSQSHAAARAAVRKLFLHCTGDPTGKVMLRIAPGSHELLAGRILPGHKLSSFELNLHVEFIAGQVIQTPPGGSLEHLRPQLAILLRFRDDLERNFQIMLADARWLCGLDPARASPFSAAQRPEPRDFVHGGMALNIGALSLVQNVAADCGVTVSAVQKQNLASLLASAVPTSLRVFTRVLDRVLLTGASAARAANSLWDMHFAVMAAEGLRVHGAPLLLITDDADILTAAHETDAADRVLSALDYRTLVLRCAADS